MNPRHDNHRIEKGFTLVSVLVMLSFLVLLLVMFALVSRVETKATANFVSTEEAKANALTGLRVAIGELQASMGADQRISVPASIFDSDPTTTEIEGVANPLWIATMPSVSPDIPATIEEFAENNREYALGFTTGEIATGAKVPRSPEMKWLASMPGDILDPADDDYDPAAPLTQSAEQLASGEHISIWNYRRPDGSDTSVDVGKVSIQDSDGEKQGAFAWWVADEGLKAQFNIFDSDVNLTHTTTDEPLIQDLFTLQQARQSNFNHAEGLSGTLYSDIIDNGDLQKVVSGESMALIDPSWANWYERKSADVTFGSKGVPVDVTTGKLKQDLTVYLETGKGLNDSDDLLRGGSGDDEYEGPAFPVAFNSDDNLPKFGILRSWNEIGKSIEDGTVVSRPQTLEEQGIHPHVKRCGTFFSIAMNGPMDPDTREAEFVLMVFPFIELWNPYNIPLPAEKYLAEVTLPQKIALCVTTAGGVPQESKKVVEFDPLSDGMVAAENYVFGSNRAWIKMVIDTGEIFTGPEGMMPGESLLFSPAFGAISQLEYNKSLRYNDYTSNTTEHLAENKMLTNSSFTTPDGCFLFRSAAKTGKFPEKSGNRPNFYHIRHKAPSRRDGSSLMQGFDDGDLFRLSRLDTDGPALLSYRGPTRSLSERGGWIGWNWPGGFANRYQSRDQINFGRLDTQDFNRNNLRGVAATAMDAPAVAQHWRQGGNRTLTMRNPLGGILRTDGLPGSWQSGNGLLGSVNAHRKPAHRIEVYQYPLFKADFMAPAREGPWGRYGAIEGFVSPLAWGQEVGSNSHYDTGTTNVHFDFPRRYGPIHSHGQLLHANLNPFPWNSAIQVGYSRAPVHMERTEVTGDSSHWSLDNENIDLPWMLNTSIWDRFYLSTLPQNDSFDPADPSLSLPNNRHELYQSNNLPFTPERLQDSAEAFNESAAHILVEGAFNVNSTSVDAWEAFLLSKAGIQIPVNDLDRVDSDWADNYNESMGTDFVAFPRFPDPVFGIEDNTSYDSQHPRKSFAVRGGNHVTNSTEIRQLAAAIVEQVKRRGPFLSMADFVNRRLIEDSDDLEADYLGLMGTIDAAILKTSQSPGFLNHSLIFGENPETFTGTRLTTDELPAHYHNYSFDQLEQLHATPKGHTESALEGWSSYLIQGDVLAHLAPFMSPRSDTFTIRSYGEKVDQFGEIVATAKCEAVMQRISEPLEEGDSVIQPTGSMGRKFVMISFRWLNE